MLVKKISDTVESMKTKEYIVLVVVSIGQVHVIIALPFFLLNLYAIKIMLICYVNTVEWLLLTTYMLTILTV